MRRSGCTFIHTLAFPLHPQPATVELVPPAHTSFVSEQAGATATGHLDAVGSRFGRRDPSVPHFIVVWSLGGNGRAADPRWDASGIVCDPHFPFQLEFNGVGSGVHLE